MAQLKDLLVMGDSRFLGAVGFTDITVSNLTTTKDLAVTGIVTSGTWNGSTIGVPYGGTGRVTFDDGEVLIGNGTGALDTLAIDSTVTASSANLITSGAVAAKLAGYAKLQAWNDLIHSGNEFTFASAGYGSSSTNGASIWLNYRTASGATDGNIIGYIFGNGAGNKTGVTVEAETFKGALSGNASTATQLKNSRNLKVSLSSTAAQAFNGTADATSIGVAGTLGTANGGTGNTSYTAGRLVYMNSATKMASSVVAISGNTVSMTSTGTGAVKFLVENANGKVSLLTQTNRGLYDDSTSAWIIYIKDADTTNTPLIPAWGDKGSTTRPVYFSGGKPVACGALVNLNGTDQTGVKASFYAPTEAGTSGYFLRSNGANKAPTWTDTMVQNLHFSGETASVYKIARKKTDGGGWAYNPIRIVGNDDVTFFRIGVYGGADALTYAYLGGGGDYDSATNFRIYPTGVIQLTGIRAPTSSGGTTYGSGTSGQVLKSNGSTVYWSSDSNTDTKVTNTVSGATTFYFTGTTSNTTNTGTQYFDTAIYTDTNAGYLYANKITSNSGGIYVKGNGTASLGNTMDAGTGLIVSRTTGTTEAVKITVDDSSARFFYQNDETSSSFKFIMHNTDTESSDGSKANTSIVTFSGSADGSRVTATAFSGNGASLTGLNAGNISSGTLPVARGGTGIASMTTNAVLLGGSTVGQVASASGAFYSTGANVKPVFGTLPIAQGGTGLTDSPTLLVNLGSTSSDAILKASPRPGVTGTLPVGYGGTGRAGGWVGSTAVYAETASKLSSSGHYMSSTQMSINQTTAPASGVVFHVKGNTNVAGELSLDSAAKFVYNSTDKCIDVIFM